MKVQSKVLWVIALLILLMGTSYFIFTYLYTKRTLQEYAYSYQKGNAEQWAQQLAYFYQENNHSWKDIDRFIHFIIANDRRRLRWIEALTLFDRHQRPIVIVGKEIRPNEQSLKFPIVVNGQKIGVLQVIGKNDDEFDMLGKTFFQSMTWGILFGILFTSLIAFLLGIWFARYLTKPLRSMIQTMNQIKQGDLHARLTIESNDEFGEVGYTFNLMTEKLVRTEQARTHLVADIAHELRTPLTIIQGQLELIQQGIKPADPTTLLPIQDEVSRLSGLVQDLHQLSLAEVGQLSLDKKPTNIKQVIHHIREMYQVEADEQEIELTLIDQTDQNELILDIDPNRITQVLSNLLSNALRYTQKQGNITIQIEKMNDWLLLKIIDTGRGIEAKHIPYLFDRFYRADEDRSRNHGGTGLGLALAKEYIQLHGGSISVTSEVGKGATFTIQLPLKSPSS